MKQQTFSLIIIGIILVVSSSFAQETTDKSDFKVVLVSEVKWEQLNPARGDQSPQAGTLWGDRKANVATGFLVKFVDGFSSPPHIHNVSYRGMVISGLIHNDDPNAAHMWMPTGSYWTQPKGEVHITAAMGDTNVAYIEIEEGPYLVHPSTDAFQTEESPVNVDVANIVWIDHPGSTDSKNDPKVSYLWGNPNGDQLYGTLIKLPAGFSGEIISYGSSFKAVLIQGQMGYQVSTIDNNKILEPGSCFSSNNESVHQVSSKEGDECVIYVRTNGRYDIAQDNE